MRSFAVMTLAFAAVFGWASTRLAPHGAAVPSPVASAPLPIPAPAAAPPASPGTLTLDRDPGGHFFVAGEVSDHPLRFVVDTGATEVALSRNDARAVGIDVDALAFDRQAQTAGGPIRTAEVRLPELSIGDIRVADVKAAVLDTPDGTVALLGQSFLSRLDRVSIENDRMTLTKL